MRTDKSFKNLNTLRISEALRKTVPYDCAFIAAGARVLMVLYQEKSSTLYHWLNWQAVKRLQYWCDVFGSSMPNNYHGYTI